MSHFYRVFHNGEYLGDAERIPTADYPEGTYAYSPTVYDWWLLDAFQWKNQNIEDVPKKLLTLNLLLEGQGV